MNSILTFLILNLSSKIQSKSLQASIAISDVVRELFIKDGIKFDTIIYGNFTNHLKDVIDEFQKILQHETQLISFHDEDYSLYTSALILSEDVDAWEELNKKLTLQNDFPIILRFLIYVGGGDEDGLQYMPHFFFFDGHITQFAHFLTHTEGKVKLWTFEEFTDKACDWLQKVEINSFTNEWKTELKIDEKFRNFYGCEIKVAAELNVPYNFLSFGSDSGIIFDIIQTVALKGNFTQKIIYYRHLRDPQIRRENPKVEFHLWGVNQYEISRVSITSTFSPVNMIFEMTPPEKFTNWEKVLLPFDEETWKFLLITFGVAFALIFIINRLPISVGNLFYGEGVRVPEFNIIAQFFGIGQLRLPDGNFARILLMIFILFCLIIRVAYQGVLFEMMTTEMRKKPPETIEDLYKQNYTIVTTPETWTYFMLYYMIPIQIRPEIISVADLAEDLNMSSYKEVFDFYIKNESAKFAFFMTENYEFKGVQLKEVLYSSSAGIGMRRNNFLYGLVEETLEILIAGGIPQHIYESYMEEFYPNIPLDKKEPQVLSLDDLSYGFIIWLVACSTNFIAFVAELLMKKYGEKIIRKVKHNLREIIGLIFVFNWMRKYLKNYKV